MSIKFLHFNGFGGRRVSSEHKSKNDHVTQILAWVAAAAGALAAVAGIASAILSGWQAWIAKDNEHRQLRAYVIVTAARFAKDDSGRLQYGLTDAQGRHELLIYYDVVNEGQTPAYDVMKLIDIEFPFTGKIEFKYTDGTAAYLPKEPTFGPVRTKYFTDDEIKSISSGSVELVFAGQIKYRDVFGDQWPTNFCFVHDAAPVESSFVFCPRMEDGEPAVRVCPEGVRHSRHPEG
jgi:hypothetical protein